MTPKLYDEVSSKLADIWGEYAGWTHSVRTYPMPKPFIFTESIGTVYCRPKIVRILRHYGDRGGDTGYNGIEVRKVAHGRPRDC